MTRNGRASGSGEAAASEAKARDAQDPEARARQICLRLLTAAPRTRAQLAQAMRRGGVPAEAAEAILVRFADAGLIDDAVFARAWVESRHHSRGLSKRSLSAELRRNGVQDERDPRGGRRARPRAGSRHRQAPGRAEDGEHPRPSAGNPRPAGGGHAGQEGLSAGPGLQADQGSHAGRGRRSRHRPRRAERARRRPRSRPGTTATTATSATPCNSRPGGARESQPAPLPAKPLAPPPNGPSRRATSSASSQAAPCAPNVRLTHRS